MLNLKPLICPNCTLDEDICHYTGVSQKVSCDGGDAILLKPGLYGSLLIGVPICSNDWLHHQLLQASKCLYALSITKTEKPPPHGQASIKGLLMSSQAMAALLHSMLCSLGCEGNCMATLHLIHTYTYACIATNCLSGVSKCSVLCS